MAKPFEVKFKKFESEPIYEGPMAHEYTDPRALSYIEQRYREVHPFPEQNPFTHPWLFNPVSPPKGFAWDPYYECWIRDINSK